MVQALEYAWNNKNLRNEKAIAANNIMRNHPSWEEVGKKWKKITQIFYIPQTERHGTC